MNCILGHKNVTESAECHFCLETIEDKEPRTFATPCCNQKVHCSCFEHRAAKRKKQRSTGKNPMLQNNNTSPMHQRSLGNVDSSHKLELYSGMWILRLYLEKNINIFIYVVLTFYTHFGSFFILYTHCTVVTLKKIKNQYILSQKWHTFVLYIDCMIFIVQSQTISRLSSQNNSPNQSKLVSCISGQHARAPVSHG